MDGLALRLRRSRPDYPKADRDKPCPYKGTSNVGTAFRLSGLLSSAPPFIPTDRVNPVPTRDEGQEVVSGFRLRRNYPIKTKKTPSIREVKEVREVRDDKPACFLIQLSQDKESGSGATPTTRGLVVSVSGGCKQPWLGRKSASGGSLRGHKTMKGELLWMSGF